MIVLQKMSETLENLLETSENYLKEEAKCISGITCYDAPNKASNATVDLYDGILANITDSKSRVIEAYLAWNNTILRFSKLMQNADFTPQERTVLVYKYLVGKCPNEIMAETGYSDIDELIRNAEEKASTIINNTTVSASPSTLAIFSVKIFLNEILPKVFIDCIPNALLLEWYIGWSKETDRYGTDRYISNKKIFLREVTKELCPSKHGWYPSLYTPRRITKNMNIAIEEPLLEKYHCESWMKDPMNDRTHLKNIKSNITRGLFRC